MFRFIETQIRSMSKGCICGMYEREPSVNLLIKIIDVVQYSPTTKEIGGMFAAEKGEITSISCYYCGKTLWKTREKR